MLSEQQIEKVIARIEGDIPGFLAASLVDAETGIALASRSRDTSFDLARAAAAESELLERKLDMLESLSPGSEVEDIVVTSKDRVHVVRPLGRTSFIYLTVSRDRSTLATVRTALGRHASRLAAA